MLKGVEQRPAATSRRRSPGRAAPRPLAGRRTGCGSGALLEFRDRLAAGVGGHDRTWGLPGVSVPYPRLRPV